jgi:hypothetical protein
MHHQSLQNEQGCIMDPSQYSSQNRHVGPLGCSLRDAVAAVGDAIGDDIVECFGKCLLS